MPLDDDAFSDDYVAKLMSSEAKTSNSRYAAYGLQELLPKRSTLNAPKPNTRFLKNILRETDSHNAALRGKENQESRERLRDLGRQQSRRLPDSSSRARDNEVGELDGHRSKRRRFERLETFALRQANREDDKQRWAKGHDMRLEKPRIRQHEGNGDGSEGGEARDRDHRHGKDRYRRRRKYDRGDELDEFRRASRRERRSRSSSRSRSRSRSRRHHYFDSRKHRDEDGRGYHRRRRSYENNIEDCSKPATRKEKDRRRSTRPTEKEAGPTRDTEKEKSTADSDSSDPLESLGLIGPRPPSPPPKVVSKGRGTFTNPTSSTIDQHFKSGYDPAVDVSASGALGLDDAEGDDWEQALGALRDRQRWQSQGAERLRQAGFSEEDVAKWERGKGGAGLGGEGAEEDVRWNKKGEGREWDRGKVVDVDGVHSEVEWGRLKGT